MHDDVIFTMATASITTAAADYVTRVKQCSCSSLVEACVIDADIDNVTDMYVLSPRDQGRFSTT